MRKAHDHQGFVLPSTSKNKAGEIFDPREDLWQFSSSSHWIYITFVPLHACATPAMVNSLKAAMAGEARRVKAGTCEPTIRNGAHSLLRHAHGRSGELVDRITLDMVQAYALSLDERHRHRLTWVKTLGRALAIHGDPAHGIEHQALRWLNKQKIPGNPLGEAVRWMDPVNGPLLPHEDRLLMAALHAAFEANEIPLGMYLRILLFRLSGMRAAQVADLKCKDLTLRDGVYTLAFPQVKKRGEGWRESFETWALTPEVGALLRGWLAQEKARWAHLGLGDDLPLFVNPRNRDPIRTYHLGGSSLASSLPSYLAHLKAPDPTSRKLVPIISPRTGMPFKISMRRFRMSLATWALMKGASLLEVAKLLGHAGVSPSLNAYIAIDVDVLEENDRKMASSEVRTAGYFRGELLDEPGAGSRLYPESFGGPTVGTCRSLCSQRKPYACYPCRLFQALMEGPHEQVLHDLQAECEDTLAQGGTLQLPTHDLTILAVRQVIDLRNARLCRDGLTLHGLLPEGT